MLTERQQPIEDPERLPYYEAVLSMLEQNHIRHGIIGGFGQYHYGGGRWPSRDLDIALLPGDVGKALEVLRTSSDISVVEKHPDWLNQLWSNGEPAYSIDLVHRHSTGLTEAKPWWFEKGHKGKFVNHEAFYAAPEAIALTKVLLWSRRSHDMPDAIQTAHGSTVQQLRPFDWDLLHNELGADWRLGYSLAVLTEVMYGKESKTVIGRQFKEKLHKSFTDNPIPSPVRGHIFAYDSFPGAGDENAWPNRSGVIYVADDKSVDTVIDTLNQWSFNSSAFPNAARVVMSRRREFDWQHLEERLKDDWRLALPLMLLTEVLYGQTGSQAIPPIARRRLSERFLDTIPEQEGQGKELFPDRFR